MLNTTKDIHVIRDATRGGVGTVLYEIAAQSKVGIHLDSQAIPVDPAVRGVCGMLGLEPLYLACEGRLVIFAPRDVADDLVASCVRENIRKMQPLSVKLRLTSRAASSCAQKSVPKRCCRRRAVNCCPAFVKLEVRE